MVAQQEHPLSDSHFLFFHGLFASFFTTTGKGAETKAETKNMTTTMTPSLSSSPQPEAQPQLQLQLQQQEEEPLTPPTPRPTRDEVQARTETESEPQLPLQPNEVECRDDSPVSTTIMTMKKKKQQQKGVSFGMVEVLEFQIVLGDNPAVTTGCPVSLGRRLLERSTFCLEDYEVLRPSERRRDRKELRISMNQRTQILLDQGHSAREIAAAAVATRKLKESRMTPSKSTSRRSHRNYDRLYGALVRAGRQVASKAKVNSL